MAPPYVLKTVPVAASVSAEECEADAEAKKWSIKAALRSSIRKSKVRVVVVLVQAPASLTHAHTHRIAHAHTGG
jgi:hypothetical protein